MQDRTAFSKQEDDDEKKQNREKKKGQGRSTRVHPKFGRQIEIHQWFGEFDLLTYQVDSLTNMASLTNRLICWPIIPKCGQIDRLVGHAKILKLANGSEQSVTHPPTSGLPQR